MTQALESQIHEINAVSRKLVTTWQGKNLGIDFEHLPGLYPPISEIPLPQLHQAVLDALREENKELEFALRARETEIKEANQRVVFLTELLRTLVAHPELAASIAAKL